MKRIIILVLVSLLLVSIKSKSKQQQTVVTYTIVQQQNEEKQIIRFSLQVTQDDPSLVIAIQQAKELQELLKDIFKQFCHLYSPVQHQLNCQTYTQTGQYNIKAEYYHLRGKQAFKTFVVKFQIEFTTTAVDSIGILIDQFSDLMEDNKIILGKISWEDMTDDIEEERFIDEGVKKGETACSNLGMKLHKIKSLTIYKGQLPREEEQVKPKPKQKKQEQGDEQQQQEQQQEQQKQNPNQAQQEQKNKYRFTVICKSITSPKLKKQNKFVNMVQRAKKNMKKAKLLTQ